MGGVVGDTGVLRNRIIKQAQEAAAEILDRAKRVSERDMVYAREEAEEIKSKQRESLHPLVEIEGRKTLVDAEMGARRNLLEKKEELVSRIFDEAEDKLEELRGSDEYMEIIAKLVAEGVTSIGANAIIEFGEKDKKIFTSEAISAIKSHIAKVMKLSPKLDFRCIGDELSSGVIVKSEDGRIIIDNSFASQLKRLKEELRGEVSEMLLQE